MYQDLKKNLRVGGLDSVRLAYSYDIMGLSQEEFDKVSSIIFRPTHAESVYHEQLPIDQGTRSWRFNIFRVSSIKELMQQQNLSRL